MDVVVVAGGRGRRFGGDKVVHPRDGRRQVDVVVARLRDLGGRVVVAAGTRRLCIPDSVEVADEPGCVGPVAGVVAGLRAATGPLAAVVAADLVEPSVALLQACAQHATGLGVAGAMPMVQGRPQPLHAVVAPDVADDLRAAAVANGHGLITAMLDVGVVPVDQATWHGWVPDARPAWDIDTRADLPASVDGPPLA